MKRVLLVSACEFYNVGAFFLRALESLGYDFAFVDEWEYVKPLTYSLAHKLVYRVVGRPPTYWALNRRVVETARSFQPQVVLFAKGAFIAPKTLIQIKRETGACLVNYATDDPFNLVTSTRDLRSGIPLYDLYVCTKRAIMDDVRRSGCANVVYVPFGYEPLLHFPQKPTKTEERKRFSSDLVFVGGADVDRVPLLRHVAKMPALQLRLYGGYWNRDPLLGRHYGGIAVGSDYRLALSGAKIALGLVRRANRDGHSMRTFEIPACGAFMLAERTDEHLELFEEDKEAVYFDSNEELEDKITYYLKHEPERRQIAEAGFRRVTGGTHTYGDRAKQIIENVDALL